MPAGTIDYDALYKEWEHWEKDGINRTWKAFGREKGLITIGEDGKEVGYNYLTKKFHEIEQDAHKARVAKAVKAVSNKIPDAADNVIKFMDHDDPQLAYKANMDILAIAGISPRGTNVVVNNSNSTQNLSVSVQFFLPQNNRIGAKVVDSSVEKLTTGEADAGND